MSDLPVEILALAEDINAYAPLRPGDTRILTARYALCMTPGISSRRTVVQRLRLGDDVAGAVAEVRALVRAHGRDTAQWDVGDSATPADLAAWLQALGMVPSEDPLSVGMVLRHPPAGARAPAAGVSVRLVEGWDDYRVSVAIMARCFGMDPAKVAEEAERRWARYAESAGATEVRYLGLADGEPAAVGVAVATPAAMLLFGGATLPEARGRGLYQALVQSRWDEAVRRGSAALVTQAGPMSRPILRRLGFAEVVQVRTLLDRIPA